VARPTEVAGAYQEIADWFDANRNKTLFERPYLERVVALAKGKRLLDLGCGTAEPLAAYFIAQGFAVTGFDIAPRMIELARARFPAQDWRVGDMRTADFGGVYDVILAWDSFFHLTATDQRGIIPKFARHAAPGGLVIFTSGTEEGAVYGVMEGHDIHHASLSSAEYRDLLEKAGFDIIVHAVKDPACGGRTVWLAQKKEPAQQL